MIGALLALASAAGFGLNSAIVRWGVRWISPYYLIVASLTIAVPIFAALAWASGQLARAGELSASSIGLLALATPGRSTVLGTSSGSVDSRMDELAEHQQDRAQDHER